MFSLAHAAAIDRDYGLRNAKRAKDDDMAYRTRSYWQRVNSGMLKRTGKLVARVMLDIPDFGLSHDDMHEVIESHVTDKVGWRLPGQSEDFFDHLAHKGLLQEVDNERYA